MFKKGTELDLVIEKTVFGGDGLCRHEGVVVFVPGGLPGDTVRASIVKVKRNFLVARAIEVLSPGPFRVPSRCVHSLHCGGCVWQELSYEGQLMEKRRHVEEALTTLAGLPEASVPPVLPSPRIYGYRNKMEFSCADKRWLPPDELESPRGPVDFALGLHVPGTFSKVMDISSCALLPEPGNRILELGGRLMRASGLPAWGLRSHTGFWRFLVVRRSEAEGNYLVNLVTATDRHGDVLPLARRIAAEVPEVSAVVNNVTAKKSGVAVGEVEFPLVGEPRLHDALGGLRFTVSSNSFFQTNSLQAENLYRTVEELAHLTGRETVLDLYCGTGTIALWLARNAGHVTGIELSEDAIRDAEKNRRENGVENVHFLAGDTLKTLPDLSLRPDLVVADPPRSGMHPKVLEMLCALAPPAIVYVSCNPATMARDLALMAEHYALTQVVPVDMFPHTLHIECVARLERKG
ncbi:MAG: 23S rRNA (uracil(1939)-C(5))-methyltransferase RlmD [Thermodesulfobacteriota bacterium]